MLSSRYNRKALKTQKTLEKVGAYEDAQERLPEYTNVLIVSNHEVKAFHTGW